MAIRADRVQNLIFEWAKEWRQGSAPQVLNDIFIRMVSGGDFKQLCNYVFSELIKRSESLGPKQIGAVIAGLYVLHPRSSEVDRAVILDMVATLLEDAHQRPSWLYEGCVFGLLLSAIQLSSDSEDCAALETRLWKIVLRAAERADFSLDRTKTGNKTYWKAGDLCNLVSDYLRFGSPTRVTALMNGLLIDLPERLNASGKTLQSLAPDDMLLCLVNEMMLRFFGAVTAQQRLEIIAKGCGCNS